MRLVRPSVVGTALAATLLSGVAVATIELTAAPEAPAALAAAEGAVAPSPFDVLATEPVADAADRSRSARAAVPAVAALGELRVPDLLVTVPGQITPEQAAALTALSKVEAIAVVDAGTVQVNGEDARVLGVDPSQFRAFTPQETASSDALWQAVARGEVAPSYALARDRDLPLGGTVRLGADEPVEARVGAVASFGLAGVDLVAGRELARSLGVAPSSAVLISAPDRGINALRKGVVGVLGKAAVVEVLRPQVAARKGKRPTTYRELYIDSARYCPGLSWTVLAAIGQVESAHGRHLGPSSAGALGPMQFLPTTWDAYGIDGDGDGIADIMSPYDAVPSAAGYLCRFGAARGPEGLYDAIFMYNHADWYVQKVLGIAAQYK